MFTHNTISLAQGEPEIKKQTDYGCYQAQHQCRMDMVFFSSKSLTIKNDPDNTRYETEEKHHPYVSNHVHIPSCTQPFYTKEMVKEIHFFRLGYSDKTDGEKQRSDGDTIGPCKETKNQIWLLASVAQSQTH